MNIIAKIYAIIKYLKNEKNQKLKKNESRKIDPKWQKGPNFFSCASSSSKYKKNKR